MSIRPTITGDRSISPGLLKRVATHPEMAYQLLILLLIYSRGKIGESKVCLVGEGDR